MDRIKGLREYVESRPFREGMGIPAGALVFCRPLAQGEYNINYVFRHPKTGKKLVLRVNTGSQMHLERQIDYEYGALKLLEGSGRTPAPFYVDGSRMPGGYSQRSGFPAKRPDLPGKSAAGDC